MNILLTGGAGYVGSHTALQLCEQGHRVVICDNLSNSHQPPEVGAAFYHIDVADKQMDELFKQHRFDTVMHFAASVSVPESMQNPYQYYLNNTLASFRLLELCMRHKIAHFILSSTAAVYGTPDAIPIDEDAPLKPINPYGTSKLMCEQLLADIARQGGFNYAILRYFNVAGADPQGRIGENSRDATHLIKVACAAAVHCRSVALYGSDYATADGTCVRDFIHVSDIAWAHCCALEHLATGGRSDIYNCGYGHGYSVREILNTVKKISGVDFAVMESARRPGDPPELIANSNKIKSILGWQAHHDDIEGIVESALNWEKKLAAA